MAHQYHFPLLVPHRLGRVGGGFFDHLSPCTRFLLAVTYRHFPLTAWAEARKRSEEGGCKGVCGEECKNEKE